MITLPDSAAPPPAGAVDLLPPPQLMLGRGQVFGFTGWAWRPDADLAAVELTLGANRAPARWVQDLRPDVFRALADIDANGSALACGYWGLLSIPGTLATGRYDLALHRRWTDGRADTTALGSVVIEPEPAQPAPQRCQVAICMATYQPDPDLFRRQIESIRHQSFADWLCLIQDDGSDGDRWAAMQGILAGDSRFQLLRNDRRLGHYRNFEACLRRVPGDAAFVALADQDDAWYPDKLAVLMAALADGTLAFADMRIVDQRGGVIAPSFWQHRRRRLNDPECLLSANMVTGAACLFRRGLLDLALPFPQRFQDSLVHDHWLALCAQQQAGLRYVNRPLHDYVQHGRNAVGFTGWFDAESRPELAVLRALMALPRALRAPLPRAAAPIGRLLKATYWLHAWHRLEYRQRLILAETLRLRLPASRGLSAFDSSDAWLARLWPAYCRSWWRPRVTGGMEARFFLGGWWSGFIARYAPVLGRRLRALDTANPGPVEPADRPAARR